jgi:hypothetical protein
MPSGTEFIAASHRWRHDRAAASDWTSVLAADRPGGGRLPPASRHTRMVWPRQAPSTSDRTALTASSARPAGTRQAVTGRLRSPKKARTSGARSSSRGVTRAARTCRARIQTPAAAAPGH